MLKINELARLHLGVKGENESKTIEIDMSAWADLYPNGTAVLLHKRYGDATKELTGATYDSDTKILTWIPTSTDTYYEGWGVAEIRMMEGDVVKKTKDLIVTAVSPSVIDGTGTVIASTYQAWLDSVIAEKTASVAAKNTAKGYSEDAEAWAIGTRAGVDVESSDPAYENNAKYYAELAGDAKDDAEDAKEAAEDAQEAAETAQHAAEDAQEAAEAAQTGAQAAAGKYPEIGENHNWYVYNPVTQQYEDTGTTARGISGVTPDMQIGTVETLNAGESATATITGTPEEPVLNLGIPKGYDGAGTIASIKMNGSQVPVDGNGEANLGTVITSHQDITGKADKVSGGTSGNFAALDAGGNLTDSGKKASDFVTDVSGKADKVSGGTTGNFASLDSSGNIADSGKKASDFVTDISGKADKVASATSGHFAALDGNGNLTDSGHKHSDYVTDVSGKADKVSGGTSGNFAALDSNGNLTDSGHKHSDYLTSHQDITGKADKVSDATSGNLAGLDGNGNLTDSGKAAGDFEAAGKVAQLEGELDIIISGDTASVNVTAGQYVTVRGSTISGVTDGIYRAANNVSSGTAFTSADLTAVTSGALNELDSRVVHNTGDETIVGVKVFTDYTRFSGSNRSAWIQFKSKSVQDRQATFEFSNCGNADGNYLQGNYTLYQMSPKTDKSGLTDYYEKYTLPTVDAGLSGNKSYDIITSKTGTYKPIYKKELTGTTSANGNLNVVVPHSSYVMIGAFCTTSDTMAIPIKYNASNWGVHVCSTLASMDAVANTSVTVIVYFVPVADVPDIS